MWHLFIKIRILMMLAPALATVLWMGWNSGAKHYERSPAEVKASLKAAYVPTHVLGSYVVGSRVTERDDQTIVTALLDKNGNELMRFVTTVEADGEGSSVKTDIEGPQGKNAERAEQAMQQQKYAMSLLELLAQEHVASAIEQRPFNMLALNPAANAMLGAMPEQSAQIDQANRSAAEMSRWEQDYAQSSRSSYNPGFNDYQPGGGDWGVDTPGPDDWGSDY